MSSLFVGRKLSSIKLALKLALLIFDSFYESSKDLGELTGDWCDIIWGPNYYFCILKPDIVLES